MEQLTQSLVEMPSSGTTSSNNRPKPLDDPERSTAKTTSDSSRLDSRLLIKNCQAFRAKVIGLDETAPLPHKLAKFVEAWIKAAATNKREKGTWMVISGPPGAGKTHSLKAARRFLENHAVDLWHECYWANPPSVLWATWSRIVALDRDEWDDWLYDLRRASIVILDDVGSEVDKFKTGEPAERLRIALETCERRWLLMSTNLRPDKWAAGFDQRVNSRLQTAVFLDMTGANDYRPNRKANTP